MNTSLNNKKQSWTDSYPKVPFFIDNSLLIFWPYVIVHLVSNRVLNEMILISYVQSLLWKQIIKNLPSFKRLFSNRSILMISRRNDQPLKNRKKLTGKLLSLKKPLNQHNQSLYMQSRNLVNMLKLIISNPIGNRLLSLTNNHLN